MRTWVPVLAGVAGAASIAASVVVPLAGAAYEQGGAATTGWAFAEIAVLLALGLVAVRVAPPGPWSYGAALPLVAVPAWLLRFGSGPVSAELVGGFVGWGLVALVAAVVGLYLRRLDRDSARSVVEARRAQRLHLARDLHDFVAHDVSGMLAQAQAGQLLAERDPAAAAAAFQRIEAAGLQALASLDRTVHMLGDPADGPAVPPATLDDLTGLVGRFASTAAIDLEVEPGLEAVLPRAHAATAYRVVVEALTNVRRHAPAATRVAVLVHRTGPAVLVSVTDDGSTQAARSARPRPRRQPRHSGLGLPGLAERVEALGGTLTAGPADAGGWRVAATLPLGPA
jgi:signal transduction histidine kinase